MSSIQELHYVAVVPPEPLRSELQEMRLEFKEKYNSSHVLKSPPHITLLSPFRLSKGKDEELGKLLKHFVSEQNAFDVYLNDFDHFGSHVIYVDVKPDKKLMHIQSELEELARSNPEVFNYNYDDRPYHPHLTLAFKDLKKKNFHKAWKEFKERQFEASFIAGALTLLQHTGERWEVKDEYILEDRR